MDLVPEDSGERLFRARESELSRIALPLKVTCFKTSIWDETLYLAWSSIVYSLIPNVSKLENQLDKFCQVCEADEVVLFERATFLVISHASTKEHEDIHRFEKISNIIKQFKLSCAKGYSQFQSMEVKNSQFTAFIDLLTSNTYVMVIMSDPSIQAAIETTPTEEKSSTPEPAPEYTWANEGDSEEEEEEEEENFEIIPLTVRINGEKAEITEKFNELGISNTILTSIFDNGYKHASAIQSASIPLMLPSVEGHVLAQAPSGSGKTCAISVGILSNIQAKKEGEDRLQAICVCHTRELAVQNFRYIKKIAEFTKTIQIGIAIPSYNSLKENDEKGEADVKPFLVDQGSITKYDVVIGTPGTLEKVIPNKNSISVLVLDEADEFLRENGSLKNQALFVKKMCKNSRIFFFSATFEAGVMEFVKKFMGSEPHYTITLEGTEFNADNLLQYYIVANSDKEKQTILQKIYENTSQGQSLLFCTTRKQCDHIEMTLSNLGYDKITIGKLHGKLSNEERDKTLASFRKGDIFHLIVTNVLVRINIPEISLVINYELPRRYKKNVKTNDIDLATYTHRVGRCTRWKNKGMAVNMVSTSEVKDLNIIQASGKFKIEKVEISDIKHLDDNLIAFRSLKQ